GAVFGVQVGVHWAGLDVIDCDLARREVAGEAFGEAGDGGFGERVNAAAGKGHALGIGAADVNDAAAVAEVFRGFLGGDENAADIHSEGFIEVFGGKFFDRGHQRDAGVVDKDVDPAKGGNGFDDGGADGFFIGGVGLDRKSTRL